ncbi:MAG: hypothetical protein E8D47_09635 [Nitrospira sp.]|nr:MAG: hypothetical protein E8D47_09635 [Nitrospira sp.]
MLFEFQGTPFNRQVLLDGNVVGRPIPTTNSTFLAFSTGVVVNVFDYGQLYAIAQLPLYRDFNGNLHQGVGYVFGMTKSFATPPLF